MSEKQIRAGDHVLHRPSGESWVVAHVAGDRLAWCGWPDGEALLSDCELTKACSDDEHMAMLQEIANSAAGRRSLIAARTLANYAEAAA